jgi:hypothetical protein
MQWLPLPGVGRKVRRIVTTNPRLLTFRVLPVAGRPHREEE